MSKAKDIKKIMKEKGTLGIAELFTVFKNIHWNKEEFEDLFATTNKLMEDIPTDIPIQELSLTLIEESPVICYRKRIHEEYRKNKEVIYKVEKKAHHSIFSVAIMPFALIAVYTVGAIAELIYGGF